MDREEALKIVRDLYEKSLFLKKDKEAITILIPELKESEDEMIRKEMLNSLKEAEDSIVLTPFKKKSWIAYLEKQKDLEAEIEKAYKTADKVQYEMGFDAGVASVQPVEWSEEDKEMINAIIESLTWYMLHTRGMEEEINKKILWLNELLKRF